MRKTELGTSPFWDYIGMREEVIENGYAEVRINITDHLKQRRGAVHGGVLSSLVDAVVGSAIRSKLSEDQLSATVELKVNYLRPAIGDYMVAKAKLSHLGKTIAVGQAEIYDPEDRLVAIGTATYMILK
jgi:acyl-CoA thioesterase